jgi:hypothetical protein
MAVACLMAVWGIWTKGQAERSIALTALGVFVVLGGLVIWWLPWMEKHWMLAMISGVVGIGAAGPLSVIRGHEQSARKIGRGSLVLVFAAVLAYNVKFAVLPYRRDSETYLAAVAAWLKHSNPEDLLLTVGDMNAPLAFWWNRPHTITQDFLYSGPSVTNKFAALRRVIEQRVSAGGDVLVAPAFLDYVWDDLAASSGTRKDDIRVGLGKYKWQSAFCYTNLIDGRITDVRRLVVVSSDGKRWPGTP